MTGLTRRSFLGATALAATGSIAGCLGGPDLGIDFLDSGANQANGPTLESLSVGGSPGGPVALQPPETVALLDFFATWCAPCKPQMAILRSVRERFEQESLSIVSITQETDRELIEEFWIDYEGTWPVATDPDFEATREYDVSNIPTLVVLDPSGREVWRHVGLASEEALVDAIDEASGGE